MKKGGDENHRWVVFLFFSLLNVGPGASYGCDTDTAYAAVNLVTALVPSDTACLASSPGRDRRTAV